MKKNGRAEDFIKISGGILSALDGAKDYSKEKLKRRMLKLLESFNLVKKEDFDVLKEMCIKVREENSLLSKKIKLLENKINKKNISR